MVSPLLTVFGTLLITASAAHPQSYWPFEGTEASSIGTIEVLLADNAKNACWTNLRESREYAEEKLSIAGFQLSEDGEDAEYTFEILVNSKRLSNGACYGSHGVEIYATNTRKGLFGFHEIGSISGIAYQPDNLNNAVIEAISLMIDEMK